MTTFEDVRHAALARIAEFTDRYPSGRGVPYRRIGVRQQELYAMAAHDNPEYGGECAIGTVDAGAVALSGMAPPVATPERITRIIVKTIVNGCPYKVGDDITVVPVADPDGLAPRAYLRHGVLYGVDGELDAVASIEIFFPYRPEPTSITEPGTRVVEIPDPHSELLVIDLTRDFAKKAIARGQRADVLATLDEEESPMLDRWMAHVREYAPIMARFAKPIAAPVPRTRRPNP